MIVTQNGAELLRTKIIEVLSNAGGWLSTSKLRACTGGSQASVIAAVRVLVERGQIETRRRAGAAVFARIVRPQDAA